MSCAAIQSIPLNSFFVPYPLEDIMDRKIANLSLNIFERLVHWICSWIYSPYYTLYIQKEERIHKFTDGITLLIDSTKDGVAGIRSDDGKTFVSIYTNDVLFAKNPNIQFTFSRKMNTDYLVVLDDEKKGPGCFKIIEQEIGRRQNPNPMLKCWHVNTGLLYQGNPRNYYLAESK